MVKKNLKMSKYKQTVIGKEIKFLFAKNDDKNRHLIENKDF